MIKKNFMRVSSSAGAVAGSGKAARAIHWKFGIELLILNHRARQGHLFISIL